MKVAWFCACLIVTLDCFEKAMGYVHSDLVPVPWLWWIVTFFWAVATVQTLMTRVSA